MKNLIFVSVANLCRSAPEFYCGFFRLLHYVRNKSTELTMCPLFLSRLRQGKVLSPFA